MANEIVKYGNELNTIPLRKFNAVEMNLFFSIISRMQGRGTKQLDFSFDDLKEISKYKPTQTKRFINDLDNTYTKMLSLTAGRQTGLNITRFVLFTRFEISADTHIVSVKINEDFAPLLNELSNWTRFGLEQFNELRSSYAKTAFRLIKQWRTVGHLELNMEDFRELLDIPVSYTVDAINKRVLKPINNELVPIFKNFKIHKIKKGRGGKIVGYRFTWRKEAKNSNDFNSHAKMTASELSAQEELRKLAELRATHAR